MTREEIIEKIRYKGEYTEAVKKRLKKLIKQYHPDVNKKDKETIKILYAVKKELEDGSLIYTSTSKNNDNKESKENNNYDYIISFFENVIENLKRKRDEINNKIEYLYNRYNKKIDEKNDKTEELTEIVFKIENLNYELEKLKKIDILDWLIIVLSLITILCTFVFKLYFLLLVVVFFIIAEWYYIYVRYLDYNNIKYLLKKNEKKKKIIDKEFDTIEDNLKELRKEEIDLKKEKSNINNDIQYYSNEINKINENNLSNSKDKGYTKK